MFNGQITHLGDTPSSETVQAAIKLAEGLRGQKEAAGMTSVLKGYDLPDGTQVYVADLSDTWTVQIVPPPVYTDPPVYAPLYPEPPLAEALPIIGLVSGASTTGTGDMLEVTVPVEGQDEPEVIEVFGVVNPSHTIKRVMGDAGWPRTAELFTPLDVAVKIGVPQNPAFLVLGDETPRTQLHSHDPGLFTGMMAPIVQLLLGVGNLLRYDYYQRFLDANDLHPFVEETVTLGSTETDAREVRSIAREESGRVELVYDYRWHRTHGVVWGTRQALGFAPDVSLMADPNRTREPFLVELAGRGIHAMPLPRDIASFYPQIRDHYLNTYRELDQYRPFDGASLFDGLGGFPPGASIPGTSDELNRWIRAGVVVKANRDLSDFYSGSAFCTGHGWAFADNGRKAINVCRKWRNGLQYGECWEVTFDITQRPNIEFNPQAEMVIQRLGLTDPVDIHKAHRLTDDDMLYIFTLKDNHKSEYEAFDEVDVIPDWVVRVDLVRIRNGSTSYWGRMCDQSSASFSDPCMPRGVQFKAFEPALGAVISTDFTVLREHRDKVGRADGPIFATYVRNQPEILNMCAEPHSSTPPPGSNRQPCQFVGQWTVDSRTRRKIGGNFYSTSRDFVQTEEIETGSITTYDAFLAGFADFACKCDMWSQYVSLERRKYYAFYSTRIELASKQRDVSIMCAANNRSAFFVCDQTLRRDQQTTDGFSGRRTIGRTGTIKEGGIYHFVWHWTNFCGTNPWGAVPPDGDFTVYKTTGGGGGCGGMLWPGEAPSDLVYSIWNLDRSGKRTMAFRAGYTIVISSPFGNNAALGGVCVPYTPVPNLPNSWSRSGKRTDKIEWKIYGMGLPEMNGRLLEEGSDSSQQGDDKHPLSFAYSGSMNDWWRCADAFDCLTDPWYVVRNHYGQPFVSTNSHIVWGDTVEYGKKPELAGGMGRILFGVVG